nr:PREDICTED: eosinophil peroxidase [Latimeria chalumnae]|eukprot:XP_014349544.1 PREDICTED: eosinophil peroxidase [Latimeria chalumnae]
MIPKVPHKGEVKAFVVFCLVISRTKAALQEGFATANDLLGLFKQPVAETRSAVRAAEILENTMELIRQMVYTQEKLFKNLTDLLSAQDLISLADITGCAAQLWPMKCSDSCLANKYRTISGVCNNRKNSHWGAANTAYARWLPAEYEDGFSLPKGWDETKQYNDSPLPLVGKESKFCTVPVYHSLARKVSHEILYTKNENISLDSSYAHILVEWGQWIDHDMDLTPQSASTSSFSDGLDCSKMCVNGNPCFPIQIPESDPRSCGEKDCMPFFRSAPACGSGDSALLVGKLSPREQLNSITSFVDASLVYGSTDSLARRLRNLTEDHGLLAVNQEYSDNGLAYLPFMNKQSHNPCSLTRNHTSTTNESDIPCFIAGDSRANEHLGMQALHTVFLREHNRIASDLHQLNPHWGGETLYQETRKILGAYHQIINWRDYIPKILGPNATEHYLPPYSGYNEHVDPRISNVFATAAFRFAHVTINPVLFRLDNNYTENPAHPSIALHKSFFSPWRIIQEGGIDPVIRGVIFSPAKLQTQTQMMPEELTEKLFQPREALSLDLASLNLQRGRDHGLPSYNAWRQFCNLPEAKDVSGLIDLLNSTYLAEKLLSVYKNPENIDVWIGAIAEPLLPGARVGELLACLLGRQFQALRDGDRFWWENEGVFTSSQRDELRKVTLSRILCDNTQITQIPLDVFSHNHYPEDFLSCNSPLIPRLNLSAWREDTSGNESFNVTSLVTAVVVVVGGIAVSVATVMCRKRYFRKNTEPGKHKASNRASGCENSSTGYQSSEQKETAS